MDPFSLLRVALLGLALSLPLPMAASFLCVRRGARRNALVLSVVGAGLVSLGVWLALYFAFRPEGEAYQHGSMRGFANFVLCVGWGLTHVVATALVLTVTLYVRGRRAELSDR